MPALLIELLSRSEDPVPVESDDETTVVSFGDQSCGLSRDTVADLWEVISSALTKKREFSHTAGEYRRNGSYVVSRHGADSTGSAKVFTSFGELCRLYGRLPGRSTAGDIGRTGIVGPYRHMTLRYFGEYPGFDCRIISRNPLTGEE